LLKIFIAIGVLLVGYGIPSTACSTDRHLPLGCACCSALIFRPRS
jgi:hypothetical protein